MNDISNIIGVSAENLTDRLIITMIIVAVGLALYYFCRKIVTAVISRITAATSTHWDDYVLSPRVLNLLSQLVFPIVLYVFMPIPLAGHDTLSYYVMKMLSIYIIVLCVMAVCSALSGAYVATTRESSLQQHPLKGLFQMLKLITVVIGIIIGVSVLIDKSPGTILTALGASAAVMMLVFKDTILGLVAGVQLSVNKMVTTGDWITIPSRNIDGIVEEITLTTVKVRNYDNTILTIPPYNLITETFQNWSGMKKSGARRVMRSLNIDMNTVRFCSESELERIAELMPERMIEDKLNGDDRCINLHLFRLYLEYYLTTHPGVSESNMVMIRQLQPTPQGLPVQLYFFSSTTEWIEYERLQADIFDHVIASVNHFGLRIFQLPTDHSFNPHA